MKNIIAALSIVAISFSGAEAQTTQINACGVKKGQVCRVSADKKTRSCYKTKYASNFKVCKTDNGYFICCETPNETNSTFNSMPVAKAEKRFNNTYAYNAPRRDAEVDMSVPQSQSYVMTSSNSYEGYYSGKHYIKVCNVSDNVAEENAAPYKGCPSPQSDGPDANNQRNINVSNPVNLPPVSGRSME